DEADLVVSGKVSAIRLPAGATAGGRRARAAQPAVAGPVSEHNPHWREAVIEIDAIHKGGHDKKQVVIRFPASIDVRWYKAPKFQPGQKGYFMLHQKKIVKEPAATARKAALKAEARAPETEDVYMALHPVDFQPYSEPGGIRRILKINPQDEA